jgi:hypothetical protein
MSIKEIRASVAKFAGMSMLEHFSSFGEANGMMEAQG